MYDLLVTAVKELTKDDDDEVNQKEETQLESNKRER